MIKISNLNLKFNNIDILKNINLSLSTGEIHLLLGENGAGKSMLLKTIDGWYNKIYSGDITIKENNLKSMTQKQIASTISFTPQETNIEYFNYSVLEIVEMGRYNLPHSSQYINKDQDIIVEKMKALDIYKLKDKSILEISTGERTRCFIARALVSEPKIILLDEPVASLDIKHKLEIFDIIHKLKNEGKTILLSIHDINDAIKLDEKTFVMKNGSLIGCGKSSEILNPTLISEVFGVKTNIKEEYNFYI